MPFEGGTALDRRAERGGGQTAERTSALESQSAKVVLAGAVDGMYVGQAAGVTSGSASEDTHELLKAIHATAPS